MVERFRNGSRSARDGDEKTRKIKIGEKLVKINSVKKAIPIDEEVKIRVNSSVSVKNASPERITEQKSPERDNALV